MKRNERLKLRYQKLRGAGFEVKSAHKYQHYSDEKVAKLINQRLGWRSERVGDYNIEMVGETKLNKVIETRKPLGLYLMESSPTTYIAVDNTTGDAWTEEFKTFTDARKWLMGNE